MKKIYYKQPKVIIYNMAQIAQENNRTIVIMEINNNELFYDALFKRDLIKTCKYRNLKFVNDNENEIFKGYEEFCDYKVSQKSEREKETNKKI